MHARQGTKTAAIDLASLNRALLLGFLAIALYFMAATAALAGDPNTAMGDVLCTVVDFIILGNLGRGLATLGIITVGVAALLGKASWGLALTVTVGISVIFGAYPITSALMTAAGVEGGIC